MSKDLKNEYLNMLEQEELPDLWGRISDRLPEKNLVSGMEENRSVTEKIGYRKKKQNIYRWSTVLAASICLLVMVPVVYQMSMRGKSDEYMTKDEAPALKGEQMEEDYAMDLAYDYEESSDVLFAEQGLAGENTTVPKESVIPVCVHILSSSKDDAGVMCFEAEIVGTLVEIGPTVGDVITIRDEGAIGEQLNLEGKEVELEIIPAGEKIFILKNLK